MTQNRNSCNVSLGQLLLEFQKVEKKVSENIDVSLFTIYRRKFYLEGMGMCYRVCPFPPLSGSWGDLGRPLPKFLAHLCGEHSAYSSTLSISGPHVRAFKGMDRK